MSLAHEQKKNLDTEQITIKVNYGRTTGSSLESAYTAWIGTLWDCCSKVVVYVETLGAKKQWKSHGCCGDAKRASDSGGIFGNVV